MTSASDEPRRDAGPRRVRPVVRPGGGRRADLSGATAQARLLGHPLRFGRRDVSGAVGVSRLSARRFWHALGLPRVADEGVFFTEADVSALEAVVTLVRQDLLDEPTALALTRAMAGSAARLAERQGQLMAEMVQARARESCTDPEGACEEAADLLLDVADSLEQLVVYSWRRHLAVTVSQLAAKASETSDDREHVRAVGFADMVGFTRVVSRLSERELGHLVERFESIASDTIAAYGGRLVKTVGDGVLFSARDPLDACGIALTLIERLSADPDLPDLRVGLAMGPVLERLGDLYGTPVNLAARLTEVARPGTIVADERVSARLSSVDSECVAVRSLWPRTVRGFGTIRMSVVRTGPAGTPSPRRP